MNKCPKCNKMQNFKAGDVCIGCFKYKYSPGSDIVGDCLDAASQAASGRTTDMLDRIMRGLDER